MMDDRAPLAATLWHATEAVVIGASSGGIEALQVVLGACPPQVPFTLIVVLHRPSRPGSSLQQCLASACRLPVREVEDKEPLHPGHVYLAPAGYHTLVERERTFALSVDEPVHYSRPSVDVLFESAARVFGARTVGLLLTGANHDGAQGLAAIEAAGGLAVVQDPATALARHMPEAGRRACRQPLVLPLADIAHALRTPVEGA